MRTGWHASSSWGARPCGLASKWFLKSLSALLPLGCCVRPHWWQRFGRCGCTWADFHDMRSASPAIADSDALLGGWHAAPLASFVASSCRWPATMRVAMAIIALRVFIAFLMRLSGNRLATICSVIQPIKVAQNHASSRRSEAEWHVKALLHALL